MMYNEKRALFLKTLTPMHAGSGTDLRSIDLPIQREVHTSFPNIQASTLKGCIRDVFENYSKGVESDAIFGKEGEKEASAAAMAVTDARLLFFPVRSAKGIYAVVTCPMVLRKFQKDMELADMSNKIDIPLIGKPTLASTESLLALLKQKDNYTILLDEYKYDVTFNEEFGKFCNIIGSFTGSQDLLEKRAVLIPDEDFKDFVTHATSIVTRIKVGAQGVAENQGLFTEEYLPEESILYSILMMDNSKHSEFTETAEQLMNIFSEFINANSIIQIGADQTLGKGFTEVYLKGGDKID